MGDDSTCDGSQHEICRTEAGVSACHCRPGHARRKHRDPCRKVVSVLVSLRVDRLYERRVNWVGEFLDKNSETYQQLSYETERAVSPFLLNLVYYHTKSYRNISLPLLPFNFDEVAKT